jgi:hypothetical protein
MTRTRNSVPELDLARIRRYVDARVPSRVAAQVRMEVVVRGSAVTIVECRPPWRADLGPEWSRFPIAQLRYDPTTTEWTLYWRDRNLRWHRYDRIAPVSHVDPLLAEIDADPTAIFWG